MNNCDPAKQQAVQDRLEALYEADGRHDQAHPMHALYTGLAQAAHSAPSQPAPPADGEVAELTGQLIEAANGAAAMGWDQHARSILRAAELLQRPMADLSPTAYALLTLAAELES